MLACSPGGRRNCRGAAHLQALSRRCWEEDDTPVRGAALTACTPLIDVNPGPFV
jgi:hypothetical protein